MAFDAYIQTIEKNLSLGNATEHTHRAALGALLESLETGLVATNEPKRMTDVGAPDYILTRGGVPLGYVEAKDVGEDLRKVERSDQLRRYRAALPNLILTDYLEFRHFVNGEHRSTAHIAEEVGDGKLRVDKAGVKEVERLLRSFLATEAPGVGTPKELAERMAAQAREIRDLIKRTFEKEPERGQLHTQLQAFRSTLIPDLKPEAFADMYAQTIAYGLFAARTTTDTPDTFSRKTAGWELPHTNPFLRNLFNEIAGPALDERVAWIVDDLAELLRRADMAAILEDFGQRTRREDPVVHFYETFLAAYDPKMRESRGVYYTPEPVVSYIVRSVDAVLKTKFGRPMGLADTNTLILDPATGTATFLYYVIRHIYESLQEAGQLGAWSAYVRDELLPRLFGFELLMAPYTVAHMKLGVLLQELGYDFGGDERLRVYLTNTLEEGFHPEETIGFAEYIAEEADAAASVKKDEPIEVIIGNPPYSGHSANKGSWIKSLVDDYIKPYPDLRKPAQAKWLSDDYVKFIRFGQWRINRTGKGILAFVTNHSYLDNPTFHGMREQLMQTFTDIYFVNLHGNSLKKEKTPESGKDENVFDIQQGVAIAIFVKEPGKTGTAKIHHTDLWGLREGKYEWLAAEDIETTDWTELKPSSPAYLFAPQDTDLLAEYELGWKITEAMNQNGDSAPGIVTTQDQFAISWTEEEARQKVRRFLQTRSEDEARAIWRLCSQSQWNYRRAMKALATGEWEHRVEPVLYRPFDPRWTVYDSNVAVHRRERVMNHMLAGENLSLVMPRQSKGDFGVLSTRRIGTHKTVAAYDINYYLPLYLYSQDDNLLDAAEEGRRPNLSPEFVDELSEKLDLRFVLDGKGDLRETFGPEDVFHYAYAVFHSPTYRERYAEFLKRDFPRLPLTSDRALFAALAAKGEELVGLHLMTSPMLDRFITRFPEGGDNVVEKVRYDAANRRVYINKGQFFEGVPEEVWGFRVGGYQVLDKWLKDRKNRALSFADIRHYQRIVVALAETRRLMREIDGVIPEWPLA